VILLDRDPRQRLPLPSEFVAPARELLLICQERGPSGQPFFAGSDPVHGAIRIEGDSSGSVNPGTLAGDTATQIPRRG